MNNFEDSDVPVEIEEAASIACLSILPEKSKKRYQLTYTTFKNWCNTRNVTDTTEKVMLAYFLGRGNVLQSPSSLWCEYSMLKATIYLNENIDISKYQKLKAFLKRKNVGYRPKKTLVFTREEIIKFLTHASDEVYLMKKVVAIIGIAGACRKDELCKMTVNDIEDKGSLILIKIPDSKNHLPRSFIIKNEMENINCISLFKKYASCRPKDAENSRFFLRYQNGRCFKQVVGKHTFAKIASEIATFLKLENASGYTGHSFRRTSATLLANTGIDMLGLKQHGGWKSSTVAEGYVTDSLIRKEEIANRILCNNKIVQEFSAGPSSDQKINIAYESFEEPAVPNPKFKQMLIFNWKLIKK